MFNQEMLNLLYAYFGHRYTMIMFDTTIDVGGVIAVVYTREIESRIATIPYSEALKDQLVNKRSRNKYIKQFNSNSDVVQYGIGATSKLACIDLINKLK